MPFLRARQNSVNLWWNGSAWGENPDSAVNVNSKEAERIQRITHANNRFLDADERAEVEIVESK